MENQIVTTLEFENEIRGTSGRNIEQLAKEGSLVPFIVGDNEGKIVFVIFAEAISGGANYESNMPKEISLTKLEYKEDGSLLKTMTTYVQKS